MFSGSTPRARRGGRGEEAAERGFGRAGIGPQLTGPTGKKQRAGMVWRDGGMEGGGGGWWW